MTDRYKFSDIAERIQKITGDDALSGELRKNSEELRTSLRELDEAGDDYPRVVAVEKRLREREEDLATRFGWTRKMLKAAELLNRATAEIKVADFNLSSAGYRRSLKSAEEIIRRAGLRQKEAAADEEGGENGSVLRVVFNDLRRRLDEYFEHLQEHLNDVTLRGTVEDIYRRDIQVTQELIGGSIAGIELLLKRYRRRRRLRALKRRGVEIFWAIVFLGIAVNELVGLVKVWYLTYILFPVAGYALSKAVEYVVRRRNELKHVKDLRAEIADFYWNKALLLCYLATVRPYIKAVEAFKLLPAADLKLPEGGAASEGEEHPPAPAEGSRPMPGGGAAGGAATLAASE